MNVRVVFVDRCKALSPSLFWQQRPGCRLSAAGSARVGSYVFSRADLLRRWMLGWETAEDGWSLAAGGLGLAAADLLADLERSCCRMEFDDHGSADALRAVREQGLRSSGQVFRPAFHVAS